MKTITYESILKSTAIICTFAVFFTFESVLFFQKKQRFFFSCTFFCTLLYFFFSSDYIYLYIFLYNIYIKYIRSTEYNALMQHSEKQVILGHFLGVSTL